jgi:hypothetical protein
MALDHIIARMIMDHTAAAVSMFDNITACTFFGCPGDVIPRDAA